MKNPCKQCLVKPMCKQSCDNLEQYLNIVIKDRFFDRDGMISAIAAWYKEGFVDLNEESFKWKIIKRMVPKGEHIKNESL